MRKLQLPDSAAPVAGGRRDAPSAERNLAPILSVLERVLSSRGAALEIASGTGQHSAAFARRFPATQWQPTDADPANIASITAWTDGIDNVLPARVLDACTPGWAQAMGPQTSVHLTNLLHLISAPEASTLLIEVSRALAPGGVFCLYGPFKQGGALVSDGDRRFDAALRGQDPAIGYKDVAWVHERLVTAGFAAPQHIEMPASNLMVIARRPAAD